MSRLPLATATMLALLTTQAAWADPTAADREQARGLMTEARSARDSGDLKGALKKFQAANDLMHVPTTAFEVAQTQASLGQLLEARDTITQLRKLPTGDNEPEAFKRARSKADELDAGLEVRIPSITVSVTGGPEGASPSITIDGNAVPASAAALPRKVDPGHHVVAAKSGSSEGSKEVDVAEGEQKQIEIALTSGSSEGAGGGEGEAQTKPQPASEGTESSEEVSHSPTALTWGAIGVGGAGLIVGGITGLMTLSKTSTLQNECPSKKCSTPPAVNDLNSANSMATISTIGFAAAGVGAVVALGSILMGHSASAEPVETPHKVQPADKPQDEQEGTPADNSTSRLHVTPWFGVASAGVTGTF
jgi:hypothetical protein